MCIVFKSFKNFSLTLWALCALLMLSVGGCSEELPGLPAPGAAGIDIQPPLGTAPLETSESGTSVSFTLALLRQPGDEVKLQIGGGADFALPVSAQDASVTLSLSSTNDAEGTVSPASITFTADNWNLPQTVTVTGLADHVADGDADYAIVVGPFVSTDQAYAQLPAIEVPLVNRDIDSAALIASPTQLRTSESELLAPAQFTLRLASMPTADVAVTVTIPESAAAEGAFVNPTEQANPRSATVTFDGSNWSSEQTLAISGVDDDLIDGNFDYALDFSITSSDATYAGMSSLPQVNVTNEDDETAGLSVDGGAQGQPALRTTEAGGSAMFEMRLTSQPTADVLIPLTSTNMAEGTVAPAQLTFTSSNWSMAQSATVTGVDDLMADGDVSFQIALGPVVSEDANYAGLSIAPVNVVNEDDDTANLTVSPSMLTTVENGSPVDVTVVLTAQPTAEVVMSVTSEDQSEGTVEPAELTFTPENWNVPQTVTVTPVDDRLVDGAQGYAVVLLVAQTQDAAYQEKTTSVSVTNQDDDSANLVVSPSTLTTVENGSPVDVTVALSAQPVGEVTIAIESMDTSEGDVSPASITFTSATWDIPQTVTVTPVDDRLVDGSVDYDIELLASGSAEYVGISTKLTITNQDDDVASVLVAPTALTTVENGAPQTFTVALGTEPLAPVTIAITNMDVSEGTATPASITFTSATWNVPQTVTITPVDDQLVDGDVSYDIELVASGSAEYVSTSTNLTVTNRDDDVASVVVAPVTLTTVEGSTPSTFTVKLGAQPAGDVTIAITSMDVNEGVVSPASITFTPADWNTPKTVTVTPQTDDAVDGDITYDVDLSASGSVEFEGTTAKVRVTNEDVDSAEIRVTAAATLSTSESGGSATFQVELSSIPTQDVVIALASSNTAEGTVPVSITFTPAEWNTPKTVTITGSDDQIADGDVAYTVTLTASSMDANYDLGQNAVLTVTNTDNDTPSVIVSPTQGLNITPMNPSQTFTVALGLEPCGNVTIGLTSSDPALGTVAPGSLTFTPANWNSPQVVTVTTPLSTAQFPQNYTPFNIITTMTNGACTYAAVDPDDVIAALFFIAKFDYTGDAQEITLGPGEYKLEVWGAQGGTGTGDQAPISRPGGNGGYSVGTITLNAQTKFYIYVGGQGGSLVGGGPGGFNGGGIGGPSEQARGWATGGGGGATDIRIGTDDLYHRVIVAGAGGGSPSTGGAGAQKYGKEGGGLNGIAGEDQQSPSRTGGGGGSQTAGGIKGVYGDDNSTVGTFGVGGIGGQATSNFWYGGGGGGGWYGGGGGSSGSGGGGGSGYVLTEDSYTPPGYALGSEYYLTDADTIAGNQQFDDPDGNPETGHSGNGYAQITLP